MTTIRYIKNDCCGCGACKGACPKKCIRMMPNQEGFLYPVVNMEACIHCGHCENVCPVLRAGEGRKKDFQEAWAAIQKDRKILKESSSGGVFTSLALAILEEGGCVFGAAFREGFRQVVHVLVEKVEQLETLRGSKYMQSEVDNSYALAQERLNNGQPVLFSGTPCQIAGLKSYLGREYENLYLVDIICHGVPSALVWQFYLDQIVEKSGEKPVGINFRQKANGWNQYGLEIRFTNGKHYFRNAIDDPYMKMFLRNENLRESCYHCVTKETGIVSDLTIGDFWGVERMLPGIDSKMGVSLVLIHTEMGRGLFEQVEKKLDCHRVNYETTVINNCVINRSVNRPALRDTFFEDLTMLPWRKVQAKYANDDIKTVIKRKLVNSVIGKIRRKLRQ